MAVSARQRAVIRILIEILKGNPKMVKASIKLLTNRDN
jgi:hypothetical protein